MHKVADTPLAIVGMACRLPGADGLDAFWQLLIEGRTDLGELPPDRFDRELHYDPRKGVRTKSYTTLGGITSDRPFDRNCCPISDELLESAHQVHLKLLDVAVSACKDAGLDPFALRDRNIGVYTGHTPPSVEIGRLLYGGQVAQTAPLLHEVEGFDQIVGAQANDIVAEVVARVRQECPADSRLAKLCSNAFHAPALISRALGLNGPAMSFDAACASGMRALGHAARALQLGQIDAAIVGAASCCSVDTLTLFSAAQSVSPTGSRPFDEDADGLVAAEGYIILVVKTLEQAIADGDEIQAVIRSIGISSDGKGKSLWAPREEGQIEAIRRAYGPHVSASDVQYIEMHATSTQVGDATEMRALTTSLADVFPAGARIPVGSVKANVGHTLETAGLASMVKTVLAMRHAVIPPQINIQKLNKKIEWEQLPFFVPQEPLAWASPGPNRPRRGAVNAFGIGGLNVHVVLDEHIPAVSKALVNARSAGNGVVASAADEPIAIVGRGAILPGARTIEAVWDMVRSGRDCRVEAPAKRWAGSEHETDPQWQMTTRMGGFITDFEYDWKRHKVPPKQVSSADPLQFMLLDAADQAFHDAGYDVKALDKMRTGAIVGTTFGAEFGNQLQMGLRLPEFKRTLGQVLRERGVAEDQIELIAERYEEVLLKHMPALIDETGSFTASTLASRITKTFDLMGGAVAVDAGDTSALAALSASIDTLRAGDCDLMVCAAGHRAMDAATFCMIQRTGVLANSPTCHPLDAQSNGLFPGEGVGVLLLKRLSDAQRDGDRIHGIIRGIGACRADSVGDGLRIAIERGLKQAHLDPRDVVVIEAGSPGMPDISREELETLADVYAPNADGLVKRIGSFTAQIGHVGGLSGMAAMLKAMGELNHAEMPANVGLRNPVPAVAAHRDVFDAPTAPTQLFAPNAEGRLIAGVNCFSQYRLAYHVLVEGAQRAPVAKSESSPSRPATAVAAPASSALPRTLGEWRIARTAADSLEQLAEQATKLAEQSAAAFANATGLTDDVKQLYPAGRYRLAIVASTAEELSTKAALAAKQMINAGARPLLAEKGVFYGERAARPKVAFLFPGQGSQYTGMFRTLADSFAPAADAVRSVDRILVRLGLPTFAELAWQDGDALGKDVYTTQLSLMAADTVMYAAVSALGLRADRVAGHSFGELAALVAAGAWTFEEAVHATKARCAAIENCGAGGILLSTSAPADVMQQLCQPEQGVFVSHYNAPDQTVVGGEPEAVRRIAVQVEAAGHKAVILDVPAAFHTPLMNAVQQPFGDALAQIPLDPPRVPLLSSVTNRYAADPADIRHNLVVQMTEPVRYTELVERLVAEGASALVEVGPKQVLTGLHKRILGNAAIAYIGCDHAKRNGLEQLAYVRACVETTGALDSPADSATLRFSATPETEAVEAAPADAEHATLHDVDVTSAVGHGAMTVLRLTGTPYEMGVQHGRAFAGPIRRVLRRYADLAGSRWDQMQDLDLAAGQPDAYFGAAEIEELRGIAAGAGVSVAGLIAHNLRLYLDAGAGGAHFAVTSRVNGEGLLHAVNEDLRPALSVNDCLQRHLCVRRPADGIAHLMFGVPGQIGSLNGINVDGLAISTAALLDSKPQALQGALITVLVKHVLERAATVDQALEIIRAMPGNAPFSLCLSAHASDRLCYVEYDGASIVVQDSVSSVIAANHRLLGGIAGQSPAHSLHRLNRLRELLDAPHKLTVAAAQRILRDRHDAARRTEGEVPTLNTIRRIDNQMSLILQPQRRAIWLTTGPSANGHQDDFLEFDFDRLFSEVGPTVTTVTFPELPKAASHGADQPAKAAPKPQAAAAKPAGPVRPPTAVTPGEFTNSYVAAAARQTSDICGRGVLRVIEAPLPESPEAELPFPASGPAVILGRNPAADALLAELQRRGLDVYLLSDSSDQAEVLAMLDAIWQTAQVPHLFLMTARDADAVTSLEAEAWQQRRQRGVTIPYLVTQRWYQLVLEAGLLERATLCAAVSLGGDFGLSGRVTNVESGALCGLLKGVRMELDMTPRKGGPPTGFRVKVVDTDRATTPAELAALLCRELSSQDREVEAAYMAGRRYIVRPVAQSAETLPAIDVPNGGTVLVTGGARGVTAVVARELAKKYGLKLHLVGSSPLPEIPEAYRSLNNEELKEVRGIVMKEALANGEKKPADAWGRFEKALEIDKTLRSFADEGVQATYHACDVSNRNELGKVLDAIRAADGPITGIIHGAGFERASRFDKKQPEFVERTLAAKVDGAAALMQLTQNDPIMCFALFGSVSGRFGGVGQTDYCAANDMLAKMAAWYRLKRPSCRTACFHWHAWDDVGMAVRPESQHIRKLHDIRFMPSIEGTRHLLEELRIGLPEAEVVVTELKADSAAVRLPATALEVEAATQHAAAPNAAAEHDGATAAAVVSAPLIDDIAERSEQRLIAEMHLDPTQEVFLTQHRYKGNPLLPVVVGIESLVEAALVLQGQRGPVISIRNLEILNGLRFLKNDPQTARVRATAGPDGVVCELMTDFYNSRGKLLQADRPCLKATIAFEEPSVLAELPVPDTEWAEVGYPNDDLVIYHGPPFRYLKQITGKKETGEAWGRLIAADPSELAGRRSSEGWNVPCALLDGCFFCCGVGLWIIFGGVVAIPQGIDRIRLFRAPRPGEHCTVYFNYRGREGDISQFDFVTYGEDGAPVLAVDGYRNVVVAEDTVYAPEILKQEQA